VHICHLTSASLDGQYFRSLCRHLAARGHDVSIGRLWSGGPPAWADGSGVRTFDLGAGGRQDLPRAVARLARRLRREHVDVVHGHLPDATLAALGAGRLARTPARVFTRHHFDENWALGTGAWALADVAMAREASAVVVASHAVRNHMLWRERLRDVHIEVIPHGLEPAESSRPAPHDVAAVREEFGLEGRYVVGAVARIAPAKGLEYLVEGFAGIAADRPDAMLLVVGAGDADPLRRQAAALGVADEVVFTGWRPDAPALMRTFDAFVHTPLTEAFGLVVIEAMAAERFVIATNVGGIPEILGDERTGLLIPPADPAAVTRALRRGLTGDVDAAALARAARSAVADRFSSEQMAAGYERLYASLLAGTRPT
jgi:glycosyltransferase involved in cell wall biosynthesis